MTISPNSSGVIFLPLYFIAYSKEAPEFSPNVPVAASIFCSARTAVMSSGMRLCIAIAAGSNQILMLYWSERRTTSPTPLILFREGSRFSFM